MDKLMIDRFDGNVNNFRQWKFMIKCALRAKGLATHTKLNEEQEKSEEWLKNDAMAMFIVTQALDYKQITLIETCETTAEILMKLESIYEQKSELNVLLIQEKFYNYKMLPTDDIAQHIAKVESMAKQLNESGESVSEKAIITKIISTLPLKYRNFRQAWLSMTPERQTINNLISRLIDEETSLRIFEDEENALYTNINVNNSSTSTNNRFMCYNCDKRGHFSRDCRAPRRNGYLKQIKPSTAFYVSETKVESSDEWIMDSGTSAHMTYRKDFYNEFTEVSEIVKLSNNDVLQVRGKGTILIKKLVNNTWVDGEISDVLYVPELRKNLFSEGAITKKGFVIVKEHHNACIYENGVQVATAILKSNNLYEMLFKTVLNAECNLVINKDICELKLWHERLGHLDVQEILKTGYNKLINIDITKFDANNFNCESCMFSKQARLSFQNSKENNLSIAQSVYYDVCGPMSCMSVSGERYFVIFKDIFSSFIYVYFIKHKSDILQCFINYNNMVNNKFGHNVKTLFTDNEGEYVNEYFEEYLRNNEIEHELTTCMPQQNGRAEREICTIVERARSMLYARDLPLCLWTEAVNTAIYISNRVTSSQAPDITPFQQWTGDKPDLSNLRTFGSVGYIYNTRQKRTNWYNKSTKMLYVGMLGNSLKYKMFDPNTKRITISRDVVFNDFDVEISGPKQNKQLLEIEENIANNKYINVSKEPGTAGESNCNSINKTFGKNYTRKEQIDKDEKCNVNVDFRKEINKVDDSYELNDNSYEENDNDYINENDEMINKSDDNYEVNENGYEINNNDYNNENYTKVNDNLRSRSKLRKPLRYEANIGDGNEWQQTLNDELAPRDDVDLPEGEYTNTSKRIFKIKQHADGTIDNYEARLYAKGFTKGKEKYYMQRWNKEFSNFLLTFGFKQSQENNCVYSGVFNNVKVLLVVIVDDCLLMSSDQKL